MAPTDVGYLDQLLVRALRERYEHGRQEHDESPDRGHSPTSASVKTASGEVVGKCLRARYWEWTRHTGQAPPNDRTLYKFFCGDALHAAVAKLLADRFGTLGEAWLTRPIPGCRFPARGRPDIISVEGQHLPADLEEFGRARKCVSEFKTTYGIGGQLTQRNGHVRADHVLQCGMEAYLANAPVRLVVANSDTGFLTRHTVQLHKGGIYLDGKLQFPLDLVFERFRVLEGYLAESKIPPSDFAVRYRSQEESKLAHSRQFEAGETDLPWARWAQKHEGDWQCGYCSFVQSCVDLLNVE